MPTGTPKFAAAGIGFLADFSPNTDFINTMDFLQTVISNNAPGVLPESPQNPAGSYSIKAGDTLESVALQLYGDASLWYLLADANGITERNAVAGEKGSQLYIGLRLNLPQTANSQHHTNKTHVVIAGNHFTGNTSATSSALTPLPPPESENNKKDNKTWSAMAMTIVAVVTAVATVMSAGAFAAIVTGVSLTSLGVGGLITTGLTALGGTVTGLGTMGVAGIGFAAGFIGSVIGQTAANAMHVQKGIDLKGALFTGLASGVTAGVSHLLAGSSLYSTFHDVLKGVPNNLFNINTAMEMMERDSVAQGLNLAFNRHQHFDWLELGVSTATGGIMGSDVMQKISNAIPKKISRLNTFISSEMQSLATGMATGHYDAVQILEDNLGNALSSSLMQPAHADKNQAQALSITPLVETLDYNPYCPIPEELSYSPIPVDESNYSPIPEHYWENYHREQAVRRQLEKLANQHKDEVTNDANITFNPGADFGMLGEALYGDGYQAPGGQGALNLDNQLKNKTEIVSNKLSLDDILDSKIHYIAELYPSAYAASKKTGLSLELMLAQGAQETGWGSNVQSGTNNMFNIKKGLDWNGPVNVVTSALEYSKNGATYYEHSEFRVYASIEESVQDRIDFLSKNKRYVDLFKNGIKGDIAKEAYVLQKAHYAGNNPHYADALIKVANGPTMQKALTFVRKYYGY